MNKFIYHRDTFDLATRTQGDVDGDGNFYLPYKETDRLLLVSTKTRDFDQPLCLAIDNPSQEYLVLEPKSVRLNQEFKRLLNIILEVDIKHDDRRTESILKQVQAFLLPIFEFKVDATSALVSDYFRKNNNNRFIPIDYFMEKRLGVCRHFAIVYAYFLSRLVKLEILKGDVIAYPQLFSKAGHIWNLFRDSQTGRVYSIDSGNNLFICITTSPPGSIDSLYQASFGDDKLTVENHLRDLLSHIFETGPILNPEEERLKKIVGAIGLEIKAFSDRQIKIVSKLENEYKINPLYSALAVNQLSDSELQEPDSTLSVLIQARATLLDRIVKDFKYELTNESVTKIQDLFSADEKKIGQINSILDLVKFNQSYLLYILKLPEVTLNKIIQAIIKIQKFGIEFTKPLLTKIIKHPGVVDSTCEKLDQFFKNCNFNSDYFSINDYALIEKLSEKLPSSPIEYGYYKSRIGYIIYFLKLKNSSADNWREAELYADTCYQIRRCSKTVLDEKVLMQVVETQKHSKGQINAMLDFLETHPLSYAKQSISIDNILRDSKSIITQRQKLLKIEDYIDKADTEADSYEMRSSFITVGMKEKARRIKVAITALKEQLKNSENMIRIDFANAIAPVKAELNAYRYGFFSFSPKNGDLIEADFPECKF